MSNAFSLDQLLKLCNVVTFKRFSSLSYRKDVDKEFKNKVIKNYISRLEAYNEGSAFQRKYNEY
jgi:hypothetical protein